MFSDHNGIKLELNKRKQEKYLNSWKLNNTLLNNLLVKKEASQEILRYT